VNVQSFTTDFNFLISPGSSPTADGFTFAIQGTGTNAIGPPGGGLGYGPQTVGGTPGIGKSVAVKFDLYNNGGEGTNSTGIFTNGASPTTPATTFGAGVNLHNIHIFKVHMTYDGTTLTMTITDTVNTAQTFTTSWPINIPGTVGANTAFVGFTGGTGGLTAIQDVLNWTYVSNLNSPPTLTSITVTPATPSAPPGTTVQFHSTGTYSDNSTQDLTSTATWASSNTTGATITAAGLATAGTAGQSTTISATSGAISGSTTLTVTAATLKSITVTPASSSAVAGTTVQFHATGTYSDNSTQDLTATAPWASSNTAGATITSAGLATAGTAGQSTTISATSGVISGSTTFTATGVSSGINFGSGFSSSGLALNGNAVLSGTRLRLTDGGASEAGSGWFSTPVNVQTFTTDFMFQLTTPNADGMTFTIQNTGTTALGLSGGGLGYGPDTPTGPAGIGKSVAVKVDLYNNAGEGTNSTGIYTNGVSPTLPATALSGGVNLHSGDIFKVHMTYDGTTLTMTITDTVNTTQTFTTSWPINIPATVGANTAYLGFTGGTGGATATQEILTWTFSNTFTPVKTPVVYQSANLTAVSSGPTFRQFTYPGFPDVTGTILDATKVGDNVTFTVNVATAGTYDMQVSYKAFNTRGIWQLAINGTNVGAPADEYAALDSYAVIDLGNFNFPAAGNYSFRFTVTGRNAQSSGYSISFDDFTLTPQ